MAKTCQEKCVHRRRSYWLTRELNDPLGLIGQTIPSTHCRGGNETIVEFDPSGHFGRFTVRCSCGMMVTRERATGCFFHALRPLSPRELPPGFARNALKALTKSPEIRRLLCDPALDSIATRHRRIRKVGEFFTQGVRFDREVLREIDPQMRRELTERLRLTMGDYRRGRREAMIEPWAERG
ncbi:MAG: hypothetical protein PHT12_03815 [Patescibacteria group bacterium]|nr:hypothetical protein [Patescibacteria group bacterium]